MSNYGTRTRAGFGDLDLVADAEPGPVTIDTPTALPPEKDPPAFVLPAWYRYAAGLSGAVCAYHGYKRNNSVAWAFGWSLFGGIAPALAVPIALAQGFGKKKASR
jgi:hypothetical protein